MQPYLDKSGTSGITAFEIGDDYINLEFKGGRVYRYDTAKPGAEHVANMKNLALKGEDLATYVNQHVRKNFASMVK
jgi:hypothetical protein